MSKIYYDLSKIRAFVFDVDGVLSPSLVPVGQDGLPLRMANIKDGYALQLAIRHGYEICIITGGASDSVRVRYETLGIHNIFMGAALKLPVLKMWMEEKGISPDEVLYMGDDIPDIPCMEYVALPTAPADAAIEVMHKALYISSYKGGHGCVRDVICEVMRAHGDWMNETTAFGW